MPRGPSDAAPMSMERGAPTAELGQTSVTAERTRSRTALSWCSAEGAGATTGTSTFLRASKEDSSPATALASGTAKTSTRGVTPDACRISASSRARDSSASCALPSTTTRSSTSRHSHAHQNRLDPRLTGIVARLLKRMGNRSVIAFPTREYRREVGRSSAVSAAWSGN